MSKAIVAAGACLVSVAFPAAADTIRLANGERVTGRVLEETAERVRVEVMRAGIRAEMVFQRGDVAGVEREADPREEFRRRMEETGRIDALYPKTERYLELGRWALGEKRVGEACEAFERGAQGAPEFRERALLEAARARLLQGNFHACATHARALLDENPNHEQARALLREVEQNIGRDLNADLAVVMERYRKGDCRGALVRLEDLVSRYDSESLGRLSRECQNRFGASLAALMVDCRFRQGCPNPKCEGGIIDCAKCEAGTKSKFNREVVGPRPGIPGDIGDRTLNAPRTFELCSACRGVGYLYCDRCDGLDLYFGKVTDFEREAMVTTLVNQIRRITDQITPAARKVMETVVDGNKTTTHERVMPDNRTLDAAKTLPTLLLARRYLAEAMRTSPALASPAGRDLHGDLSYVEDLIAPILNRKMESYLAAAFNLMGAAVGAVVEGKRARPDVNQMRRSLVEASKARHLTERILDIDPTSRGALGEDMEQRQRLIDEFLQIGNALLKTAASDTAAERLRGDAERAVHRLELIAQQAGALAGHGAGLFLQEIQRGLDAARDRSGEGSGRAEGRFSIEGDGGLGGESREGSGP